MPVPLLNIWGLLMVPSRDLYRDGWSVHVVEEGDFKNEAGQEAVGSLSLIVSVCESEP